MDEKKKWGRPKGIPQNEETKKKISEGVKRKYNELKKLYEEQLK